MNTGTVLGPPPVNASNVARGLGTPSADRPRSGRSRRSSPRPGEPVTGRRTAVVSRRDWRLSCRKTRHRTMTSRPSTTSSTRCGWVRGGGYRRCRPRFTVGRKPTAGTMKSPLRGDTHGGFGERPGETDQQQCRHRPRPTHPNARQPADRAAHPSPHEMASRFAEVSALGHGAVLGELAHRGWLLRLASGRVGFSVPVDLGGRLRGGC